MTVPIGQAPTAKYPIIQKWNLGIFEIFRKKFGNFGFYNNYQKTVWFFLFKNSVLKHLKQRNFNVILNFFKLLFFDIN